MKKVGIIDYGMGNLNSVYNAFISLGADTFIAREAKDLAGAGYIVLPGVGAFGDGMNNLQSAKWIESLENEVHKEGKPFLGICLGMQLLATWGSEHGRHKGLDWIPGTVERIASDDPLIRVPHIGWNDVRFIKKDGLYQALPDSGCYYFVHSYVLAPDNKEAISATFSYGNDFVASIEVNNINAVQYHPEKSQKFGLAVLKNFLAKG